MFGPAAERTFGGRHFLDFRAQRKRDSSLLADSRVMTEEQIGAHPRPLPRWSPTAVRFAAWWEPAALREQVLAVSTREAQRVIRQVEVRELVTW